MGNEVTHVSIGKLPMFRELFEEYRIDLGLAQSIARLLDFESDYRHQFARNGGPFDPERQRLSNYAEGLVSKAYPEKVPVLSLDRHFDWLSWSMAECVDTPEAAQLVQASVFGTEEFAVIIDGVSEVARGGQGFRFHCSGASQCVAIAAFLDDFSMYALAEAVDLSKMVEAGVYKARKTSNEVEMQAAVVEKFASLRDFYGRVGAANDSVLVIRD